MLETVEASKQKTGLEFAHGTTEDTKKVVCRMFQPMDLLGAYREARNKFNTTDIVLAASDQGPEIQYTTRAHYTRNHLQRLFGKKAAEFRMWHASAQSVMKLPQESEAMWLIVDLQGADLPIMCVIYAIPYKLTPVTN